MWFNHTVLSPNDGRLFFLARFKNSGLDSAMYSVNVDGSDLRQLTRSPHDDLDPIYLPDGNIHSATRKRYVSEDNIVTESADYKYQGRSHRLDAIEGNLRGVAELGDSNFEYDANGNMIKDKTKGLEIEYDWRNMPIRFKFTDTGSPPRVKYVIQVLYDASGNRVAKFNFARNN